MNITSPDWNFAFSQPLNPLLNGHIAFLVDDVEALERRLDDKGVKYADYSTLQSRNQWSQIFALDPAGMVELRQRVAGQSGEDPPSPPAT